MQPIVTQPKYNPPNITNHISPNRKKAELIKLRGNMFFVTHGIWITTKNGDNNES